MKSIITRFEIIADSGADDGLRAGSMTRIPPVVAIAGPNGAGKTRLLDRVKANIQKRLYTSRLFEEFKAFVVGDDKDCVDDIGRSPLNLDYLRPLATAVESLRFDRGRGIVLLGDGTKSGLNSYLSDVSELASNKFIRELSVSVEAPPKVIEIASRPILFDKTATANLKQLKEIRSPFNEGGNFTTIATNAARILHQTVYESLAAMHPNAPSNERAVARYEKLQELLTVLMNVELGFDQSAGVSLFGRGIDDARLSEGQTRLLGLCAALFDPGELDDPTVVFMDEPENHIHPAAIINLIDVLERFLPNGQIWIATHCVPLLAHLDPTSIWCMKDGEVFYAGNRSEEVLTSLLGGDDNVHRLSRFLARPAELAATVFTQECLLSPATVPHVEGDPQTSQVLRLIESKKNDNAPVRVLDWGAGRGRLAVALAEELHRDGTTAESRIEYFAFDISEDDADVCLESILHLHQDETERHFFRYPHLFEVLEPVDVVVLCNVLHEVPPEEWVRLLGKEGIAGLLEENGVLLLVEDMEIPHGELAHPGGFLLLERPALARLLGNSSCFGFQTFRHSNAKYANRLMAHEIPQPMLKSITAETVVDSVNWCSDQACRKIRELRDHPDASYQHGRTLALQLQQFANAELYLKSQNVADETRVG